MGADFLTSPDFSKLVGISNQRGRAIFSEFTTGRKTDWQGHKLQVRIVHGKGGAGGKQYEVAIDSLPDHLKARLKASQTALKPTSTAFALPRNAGSVQSSWWYTLLRPVLDTPKNSSERANAYNLILSRPLIDWNGQAFAPSLRTLSRKLAKIEADGMAGLARAKRADAGQSRTILSRKWDAYVPFDDTTKAKIAAAVTLEIQGYVKGGARPSKIKVLVRDYLVRTTQAYGFRPNTVKALEKACSIPKHLIDAESKFKAVYRQNHNRKASEDDAPRIRRNPRNLMPMDEVVMDVHHINVLIEKETGKTGTAKLLAFMDMATQRVWCELIFFEKAGGVRNVDNIDAFVKMAQHPAFGLPQLLYCDNGSEYLFADYLGDALNLLVNIQPLKSPIRRANPYNAAAKPIEGWFGRFEQQYLRHCEGWIDDDRMNPARPQLGKLPAPFTGGFDSFRKHFFRLLRSYEYFPQTGGLSGLSPSEKFQEFVDSGWSATIMNAENLRTVFTKPETRTVRQHSISVDGRIWTCPELDTYFENSVTVRIPAYHGYNELLLLDRNNDQIGIATPSTEYAFNDSRGAKQSAQRKSDRIKAIRKLDKSVPDKDVGAEIIKFGERHLPVVPNEPRGVVSVNSNGPVARMETPRVITDLSNDEMAQARADAQRQMTEGLAKYTNRKVAK